MFIIQQIKDKLFIVIMILNTCVYSCSLSPLVYTALLVELDNTARKSAFLLFHDIQHIYTMTYSTYTQVVKSDSGERKSPCGLVKYYVGGDKKHIFLMNSDLYECTW